MPQEDVPTVGSVDTGARDGRSAGRALVVDVALAIFVLVTVATAIVAELEPGARDVGPGAYLFAAALAAPMLGRRRWPVAMLLVTVVALLVYYALGYPAIGLAVPLAAALYSAAERGRLRWALGVAGGLLVFTTALRLAQGQDLAFLLGYEVPLSATLMAAVVFLGDAVRQRRAVEHEARLRALHVRQDREREAQRRVTEERLRIARDLHDIVGHTVSVISLQADVAAEAIAANEAEPAARAVRAIKESSREAMGELRSTLGLLRDDEARPPRRPLDGLEDVRRVVGQARDSGLDVDLEVTGAAETVVHGALGLTAYRIVQEALTNTLRHAGARRAQVRLAVDSGRLVLTVQDDGRGAGPAAAPPPAVGPDRAGHGLHGMRERAELIGGSLVARSLPDGGFRVEGLLPLPGSDDRREGDR